MDEMRLVAEMTPVLAGRAERRAGMALLKRVRPDSVDEGAARAEFASLTGMTVEAA